MGETAQISMSVQALKQTSVIPTLFVTILSDPTSVAVLLDIRAMVETAQMSMNVQVPKQMNVTPTLFARTQQDLTFVVV